MTQDRRELLEKALAEAYASAPAGRIPLDAMELDHPTFTEPLRVVRWPVTGPEPAVFRLRLEDEAPVDAGLVRPFIGFPFELKIPESSSQSEGTFEFRLAIYDQIDRLLMNAALNPGIITAIYRQYIKGSENDGPASVWPGIEIQSPRREGGDIVATGAILGWMRRPFGSIYTPGRYPGIVTGR